ncbi:hypothetical protein AS850_00195 [Frondihabitans sp. 762G35]|nr:DUF1330 domain-containing protein [Frondihabitans sp. 762G35]ARC55494.1 hypothetical protein AS850_00195 [Frondihabitans sp. 762G35]
MSDTTATRTPAYSITEVLEVIDPAGAQRYSELTPVSVEKVGGRFVVLGAQPTVAEGDAGLVLAVVESPTWKPSRPGTTRTTTPRPARSQRRPCAVA